MRRLLAIVLVAIAPVAGAVEAKSPGPDWTEANRTDDLVIFTKDVPQGRKLIAVGEVEATPEAVFNAVVDFEHYPEFMPYVKESKIVSRKSESELVAYAMLSPPLVDDRDYAIKVTMTKGGANGGVWKSEWTAAPDAAPARDGIVRVVLNDGSWTIEALDGGKRSRLTYTLLTHPGGSIPNWIANKSNTVAIPDLYKAIRTRTAPKK